MTQPPRGVLPLPAADTCWPRCTPATRQRRTSRLAGSTASATRTRVTPSSSAAPHGGVDRDPAAVALTDLLLTHIPSARGIEADLRRPDLVLAHPDIRGLIDPHRPLGVLAIGVLDTLTDDEHPDMVIERYLALLPAHSHLALTHLLSAGCDPDGADGDPMLPAWTTRHPRPESTVRA